MDDVDIDVGLYPRTFIRLTDSATGDSLSASLDREAVTTLVTQLLRAFPFMEPGEDANADPLFSIVNPAIEVARSPEGKVVVTIAPLEMPAFEMTVEPVVAARTSDRLAEEAY